MLAIIKNDWQRMLEKKGYLIMAIVLTIVSVASAIFVTNNFEMRESIAIVDERGAAKYQSNKFLNIEYLKEDPPMSEIVQSRYDAAVHINKDGTMNINTIKSHDIKLMIESYLKNPKTELPGSLGERKIGTNIIGFMMMFLLMQGVLYARLFAEDKEKHIAERIAVAPISFKKYILGHSIFIMMLIFIPSFAVVIISKAIGVNIGLSLIQYGALIFALSVLATAFALFIDSFFISADTANMFGSSVLVLTSILAGSFYSFAGKEDVFDKVLHILPQKDLINFVDGMEKGNISLGAKTGLVYVVLLIIAMFAIAVIKTKKDYVYNK